MVVVSGPNSALSDTTIFSYDIVSYTLVYLINVQHLLNAHKEKIPFYVSCKEGKFDFKAF